MIMSFFVFLPRARKKFVSWQPVSCDSGQPARRPALASRCSGASQQSPQAHSGQKHRVGAHLTNICTLGPWSGLYLRIGWQLMKRQMAERHPPRSCRHFIVSACLCTLSPVQMILGAQQGFSYTSFYGCLENPVYNGLNLVDLAKQKDQRVTVKVNLLIVCCWKSYFVYLSQCVDRSQSRTT